jgi:hypothetical protein
MGMFMLKRLVNVFMLVPLGHVQPQPESHQRPSDDQLQRQGVIENDQREQRADEWGQREVSSGSRGAEVTKRQHEHDQAYADTEKASEPPGCEDTPRGKASTQQERQQDVSRASH